MIENVIENLLIRVGLVGREEDEVFPCEIRKNEGPCSFVKLNAGKNPIDPNEVLYVR